jgi:hypothetical protein
LLTIAELYERGNLDAAISQASAFGDPFAAVLSEIGG